MAGSEAEERIRAKAETMLRGKFPAARIIHELVLAQGGCRIDIAAVWANGFAAVEIKSERDNFDRLRAQIKAALPVSTVVWVCIAADHQAEIIAMLQPHVPGSERQVPHPKLAGAWNFEHDPNPTYIPELGKTYINVEAEPNAEFPFTQVHHPSSWDHQRILSAQAQLEMLWAEELRRIVSASLRRTRGQCVRDAVETMSGRDIRRAVCAALRTRQFPRADPPILSPWEAPQPLSPLLSAEPVPAAERLNLTGEGDDVAG